GDVKFDEATKLYERGATLCEFLSEKFKEAKGKITKISEVLGTMLEEDFK
ncbi:MAG: exodeoxyribonuclease VII small subunit, partial [Clostridia bacterium]|nr:exodeoxyribonuclease VII small subunit [Clostridia bacterium]